MRVWLLHIGEELPVDGSQRQFRYGYLADALAARGHSVLRWAPTFRHTTRQQRFAADRRVEITSRYSIQFVHAPGYRRTASVARLRHCHVLGRRLRELAHREAPPHLIVAAIPSLEWANAAVDIGSSLDAFTVVDVRDLWPDVFPCALPFGTRTAGRLCLYPYRKMARRACRCADALSAVSETYLAWALQHAGRSRRAEDIVTTLGFEPAELQHGQLQTIVERLGAKGIDPRRPTCFFAGGFERHHDFDAILGAARCLAAQNQCDVQFVLCGDGSRLPDVRRQSAGLRNVHLLGHVDAATLQAVASISVIGLCAYAPDALMSLGNKPFEYMAGSLALVSSLEGELHQIIRHRDCGISYLAGNSASLARAIASILADPARLNAMRKNSYRAWQEVYRTSNIYPHWAERLESLASRSRRAA